MKTNKKGPSKIAFNSTHHLPFEIAPWEWSKDFYRFRVGTCHGLWRSTQVSYDILAIKNSTPGNGHFEDVLQWFEHSCRRDGRFLCILEITNDRLFRHLINKRGFRPAGRHCVKEFG